MQYKFSITIYEDTIIFFTFPINRKDRWGTIDDFLTSSLHDSLFSTALWESANSIPVHSLMLSSHLFFCLPLRLLLWTASLVTWSFYDMRKIFRKHLISMARILFCISAERAHVSEAYRKMDMTRERISLIFELTVMFLSFH